MAPTPSPSKAMSSQEIVRQLTQILEELKKEGKVVRIQICPQCKSPNIRGQETWYDIGGAMGISSPKYRCLRCGYWGRVILEATNADFDERMLDELIRTDAESAQKLLNDITQHSATDDDQ
jgi:C4-type Zn-finger protein